MSNLALLRNTTLRDIPATLRQLADSIEAQEPRPDGCSVVWEVAGEIQVSYCGEGEAGPRAFLLLSAAAARIMQGVLCP